MLVMSSNPKITGSDIIYLYLWTEPPLVPTRTALTPLQSQPDPLDPSTEGGAA